MRLMVSCLLALVLSTVSLDMAAANDGPEVSYVAMVALPEKLAEPLEDIVERLRQRRGGAAGIADADLEDGTLAFDFGGSQAVVSLMGAPIPWGDLEGPCQTAWWWADACKEMKGHRDHLIVAVLGDGSDRVGGAIKLTDIVAAVLEATPATGVYWGSGTLVTQRDLFLELAQDVGPESLPIMLWIDIRVVPNEDDTWTIFTTGMSQFGLMEIESETAQGEGEALWTFVHDLASYLLLQGPVIEDGHTVGPDAATRVSVRFAPSVFPEREGEVYRLEFESPL